MKILVAHNSYRYSGGEDGVVESEVRLLRDAGHVVTEYRRSNKDIGTQLGRVRTFLDTFWSARTMRDVAVLIDEFQPDLVHAHNTFPLISPALYWAAAAKEIPVVQTLHNFRLLCPQAMFLRDGAICEDCLGRTPWRAVSRRCYRGSLSASAVTAAMLGLHRAVGTFDNKVARYVALSEFSRRKFVEGGLPADRISVKPNFSEADPGRGGGGARKGFLFVGRLSPEKGLATLAQAARWLPSVTVNIVGSGPAAAEIEESLNIRLVGHRSRTEVQGLMAEASCLVIPSIWYEGFPLVIVEAFASSLPIIASRLGALADLVKDGRTGLLFEPGNAKDLAEKMRWMHENPQASKRMGEAARATYEARYTPERNYGMLMEIYGQALKETR